MQNAQRDTVVARAPLRVSFLGGGSDVRDFYSETPGFVVSTAINCYIDVVVRRRRDNRIRVITNAVEVVDAPSQLSNSIIREALQYAGGEGGYDLSVVSDVTRAGSGLGSSSALIVAILYALARLRGQIYDASALASQAAHVEIELAGRKIGQQDHYPPAHGGLCRMEFANDGRVTLAATEARSETVAALSGLLMLADTGVRRDAAATLERQSVEISAASRRRGLSRLVELARSFDRDLEQGSLEGLPDYLQEAWEIKTDLGALAGQPRLRELYDVAVGAGALGGKILGAGGGGHFLFLVPPERQARFREVMPSVRVWPVAVARHGCRDLITEVAT
jgi:D-glycero-alpha-D-manno-heptose-7-phosphate kinase